MDFEWVGQNTVLVGTGRDRRTLLTANDQPGFERFFAVLRSRPSGTWDLAAALAVNGVTWPAFGELFRDAYAKYRSHADAKIPTSRFPWTSDKTRSAVLDRRIEIIRSMGCYIPDEMLLPYYLEVAWQDVTVIHRLYGGIVTESNLSKYFIGAMTKARLFLRTAEVGTHPSFNALLGAGLRRVGADIPIDVMLQYLGRQELAACVRLLGETPASARLKNLSTIEQLQSEHPTKIELAVRDIRDWTPYACTMPPEGVDWEGFQGMRQQAKAMVIALRDFLGGWLERSRDPNEWSAHAAFLWRP